MGVSFTNKIVVRVDARSWERPHWTTCLSEHYRFCCAIFEPKSAKFLKGFFCVEIRSPRHTLCGVCERLISLNLFGRFFHHRGRIYRMLYRRYLLWHPLPLKSSRTIETEAAIMTTFQALSYIHIFLDNLC